MNNEASKAVLLANPIPLALGDYLKSLTEILTELGIAYRLIEAENTERIEERFILRRVVGGMRYYLACSRAIKSYDLDSILVCWPLMGHIDFIIWAWIGRRRAVRIVIHDIEPPGDFKKLKRYGYLLTGEISQWLAKRTSRRIRTVVHSTDGLRSLRKKGWRTTEFLPLPIGHVEARVRDRSHLNRTLIVAGQYKPIRDLRVMEDLAELAADQRLALRIVGKGWPSVKGWDLLSGFIPEAEFQEALASSTAVLIPYSEYSQSAVSVRAFEVGTPSIGVDHPQQREMFGENHAGTVAYLNAEEILRAFARVAEIPREYWLELASEFRMETLQSWRSALLS